MGSNNFINRETLSELDDYRVDGGKYVGLRLGDAFDDLSVSEQEIVKPYLDKLKEKVSDMDIYDKYETWEIRDELLKIIDNLLLEERKDTK